MKLTMQTMSLEPSQEAKETCKKKRRHPDSSSAKYAGRLLKKKEAVQQLWIYQCAVCQGWHLSKNDSGIPV